MSKSFLIAGGTGFLGCSLIERLKKNKNNLITCIYSSKKKFNRLKNVKYLKCDISKIKEIRKIKGNYDYIINFAGYVNHKDKTKTILSHYNGCKNLANFFSNNKTKLFIQVGSSLEYGKKKSPHKESLTNHLKELKSHYSKAKLMATNYLYKLTKENKINACVIRPYLIYGPKQDFNRFIPIVIRAAILKKDFSCSHGKQLRDYLYIDDFVNLIINILKSKRIKFEIYNAGSGKPIRIKKIINFIINLAKGGRPRFGQIKTRPDEAKITYASLNKVKKNLNWYPKVSIKEGLIKTYNYYKKYVR